MYQSSTTYVYNTYTPSPEAYITKGKNRLKQNGLSVYLNNNDEFELELFNPKSTFSINLPITSRTKTKLGITTLVLELCYWANRLEVPTVQPELL